MSSLNNHAVGSSSYSPPPCRQYAFSEIQRATQNFDESLVIGRGGFGKVYKGIITCGETLSYAAIKRLESTSNQGAAEFFVEVETLSKLRHSHLVSLYGYCNDGQEMILVYEYMPNGTLADHLHKRGPHLTWERRLEISIGAARGLDYLHTGTGMKHGVIHRGVKSTNILLDENWAAKISDFGLSKVGATTNQASSYVNTVVKGTFGYLDPDYFQTGRLTRKSDVYAFGVVLFEALSGKPAVDRSIDDEPWGLAAWAQDSIKEKKLKEIVDSNLREVISHKCLKRFALLADQCLHSRPKKRPSMAEVVVGLESILLALGEKTAITLFSKLFGGRVLRPASSSPPEILERNNLVFFDYGVHNFDLEDLLKASTGLPEVESFGTSYRLIIEEKSRMVAVKRLKDVTVTENGFKATMEVLGKVKNKSVVPLIAYYCSKSDKLLVYDRMPASSLFAHLHGSIGLRTQLNWDHRMGILLSIAKGLAYLHVASYVVHGNIKSSNIFIQHETNNYEAYLSDYGLNMLFDESSSLNNEISAYQAPEVRKTCKPTFQSDVYSFGVLLVELLTGKYPRQATYSKEEPSQLNANKEGVRCSKLVDSVVCEEPRVDIFYAELLQIANDCVSIMPNQRPTMQNVLSKMEDMWLTHINDHSKGYDYTPSTETRDTPSTITP